MLTQSSVENPIIQPPNLLIQTQNPQTGEKKIAFPLQTKAWLKMQTLIQKTLDFPLSPGDFQKMYGTFSEQATVETAVAILSAIRKTGDQYGDPTKLISEIVNFQKSPKAPKSIYGNAVWLASQTQLAAQQIASFLKEGLKDIGNTTDPQTRIKELTELLTGKGGINSFAKDLQTKIQAFEEKIKEFYTTLNTELTAPTNSLGWYLKQADNVLREAMKDVDKDEKDIREINKSLKKLNEEYIGFIAASSASPALFFLIPLYGPFIAVADAVVFGVLAAKVKKQIDGLKNKLKDEKKEKKQKTALVTQLMHFNDSAENVATDEKDFLKTISTMISAWGEFDAQVSLRLKSLTVEDVKDWSAFLTKIGFQTSLDGWELIESKAEQFYQTGFVQFSKSNS